MYYEVIDDIAKLFFALELFSVALVSSRFAMMAISSVTVFLKCISILRITFSHSQYLGPKVNVFHFTMFSCRGVPSPNNMASI